MKRLLVSVVGIVIVVLGFALSSGTLTILGGLVLAAGVVWFVMTGTGTRLGQEFKQRP